MNTPTTDTTSRPLGYWLKTVDRLLAAQFATAFENEGATRRDWRVLNIVDGSVASDRPLRGPRVHALAERGWITRTNDTWALTDEGRATKQRLGEAVTTIRARVSDAVPAEDLATTLATLEALAREFGWDENARLPHKRHGRFTHRHHGHSRRHGCDHQHSHQHRDADQHDNAHQHDDARTHECDHHASHGRRHGAHRHGQHHTHHTEHAFARGFDAGFSRGRDA